MKKCLLLLLLLDGLLLFAQDQPLRRRIVPDFAVAQYAGSIGFISAGIGYEFLKRKAVMDVLAGYVPQFTGSVDIFSLAAKLTFNPWSIRSRSGVTWHPVTGGLYLTYSFGDQFYTLWPSRYPTDYYWWSEAIRPNIFIGGSVDIPTTWIHQRSRLIPYYEIGTNEVKLISYAQNAGSLSFWKIIHVGIGARYRFPNS